MSPAFVVAHLRGAGMAPSSLEAQAVGENRHGSVDFIPGARPAGAAGCRTPACSSFTDVIRLLVVHGAFGAGVTSEEAARTAGASVVVGVEEAARGSPRLDAVGGRLALL